MKNVFYFMEKTTRTFWPIYYIHHLVGRVSSGHAVQFGRVNQLPLHATVNSVKVGEAENINRGTSEGRSHQT